MAEIPRITGVKRKHPSQGSDVLAPADVGPDNKHENALSSCLVKKAVVEMTSPVTSHKVFLESDSGNNTRKEHKMNIKSKLLSGNILQICGPPMVGKSHLVEQAVREVQELQSYPQQNGLLCHSFMCKRMSTVQDVLATIMTTIQGGVTLSATPNSYSEAFVLGQIESLLQRCPKHRHIFVFHKCESLRTPGSDHEFLAFLTKLCKFWWSSRFMVSVVFTTFKKFSLSGNNSDLVEVGMLTDPIDIKALLESHAPGVDVTGYIKICQKFLSFPEAVVRFAEEYLVNEETRCCPEHLEKRVCVDADFLSLLFEKRLRDVEGWLTISEFDILMRYSTFVDSFFTDGNLIEEFRKETDGHRFVKRLREKYVVHAVHDGCDRLALHPLLVYYIKNGKTMGKDIKYYNRSTIFLCHILKTVEKNIQVHGRKGQVYGCLPQEWPTVRLALEQAINCRSGNYGCYLKAAVIGRRLLMSSLPNESRDFFQALLAEARLYGTHQEQGVLLTYLGQCASSGVGINWKLAEEYLDSAIEILKQFGPANHYKWALARKANVLQRQGNNQEADKYFTDMNEVSGVPEYCEESLKVSQQQEEETNITMEILATIPKIFMGDNEGARKKLLDLLDELDSRCPNHPDVSILLNNIGLTFQRGNKDLKEALKYYERGYILRRQLETICPQDMVVPLNNLGMCFDQLGDFKRGKQYLDKALEIQLERTGQHYYTALTLVHIAELSFKDKKCEDAFKKANDAEFMLTSVAKHHDFRLRVLNALLLYTIVMRQRNLAERAREYALNSAEDLLEYILTLGNSIKLTDDGNRDMMTSYVHGMILNCKNSPERFQAYKKRYLSFVQELKSTEGESKILSGDLKELFSYIRDTQYEDLDLETVISYMKTTCAHCKYSMEYYNQKFWQDEVAFIINQPEPLKHGQFFKDDSCHGM